MAPFVAPFHAHTKRRIDTKMTISGFVESNNLNRVLARIQLCNSIIARPITQLAVASKPLKKLGRFKVLAVEA